MSEKCKIVQKRKKFENFLSYLVIRKNHSYNKKKQEGAVIKGKKVSGMIDGHIHYAESLGSGKLDQLIEEYKIDGIALQCIPKDGKWAVENDALRYKEQSKIPVYVFGGIARDIFELPKEHLMFMLPEEISRLMELGCTGIKMLEGKPIVRKEWPIPNFDDMVWDPYFNKLEEEQVPVMFHINDPEEFWDAGKISEFAKKSGWFYDDTYINNEEQYRQIEERLKKNPDLRICFPHFFFLSNQLERLGSFFDRYRNVRIDLAPGIELYYNLSRQRDKAREFFIKYQDRICYGSDIGARSIIRREKLPLSIDESRGRIALITRFLEEKDDYILSPDGRYVKEGEPVLMHGLGLDAEVLEKIYRLNFLRFIGKEGSKGEAVW